MTAFEDNKGEVVWKHNEVVADKYNMFGKEPSLTYTFKTSVGGDIPTTLTQELHVKVDSVMNGSVLIPSEKVKFEWTPCSVAGCTTDPNTENPAFQFRIHLDNGELTIEKTVTKWNYAKGEGAAFVFKIESDDGKTYYCTIDLSTKKMNDSETITLPAGTYTVTELPTAGYKLDEAVPGNDEARKVVVSGSSGEPVEFTNTSNGDKIPGDNSSVLNKWINGLFERVTSEAANG